jgi:hypothetical protein
MKTLLALLCCALLSISLFAQFEAGDNIRITQPYPDDIYIAGGEVTIEAPVYGDAVLAGGNINVNDSILQDLTIGGGEINVRGYVGDDIRVAGGSVEINSDVMDDLIVFAGEIRASPDATIYGNVVSYGGELTIDGTVLGQTKASGGKIVINGSVEGDAVISAGDLEIGDGASFLSNVSYWAEGGDVDFGNSVKNGEAKFDSSLAWEGSNSPDASTILGFGVLFMILFLFGGYLILLLLEWVFGQGFTKAAQQVMTKWSSTLGVGVIYVVGVPLLTVLSFSIVIGIPVGLFVLFLYLFSMVFGNFVAALILVHLWKEKKQKNWNIFITSLIALGISLVLQGLTSIPFIGILISFAVLCTTYGSVILVLWSNKSQGGNQAITA